MLEETCYYMSMFDRRLQVLIDEGRWARLEDEASRRKVSVSTLVREGIDERYPGRLRVATSLKSTLPGVKAGPAARRAVEETAELLRSLGHEVGARDPKYGQLLPDIMPRYLAGVADDAAREPPVCVDYLRLEMPAGTHGLDEIGAEESHESEFRCPRCGDVARHVAGVCELFIAPRRIAKAIDRHSLDLFRCGDSVS